MACKYRQKGSKFWWIEYYQDGKQIRKSLKTIDSKTADYLIAKKEQELIEGGLPPALKDITFKNSFQEYLDYSKGYKTTKSYEVDYWNLKRFFDKTNPLKLKDITAKVIEEYLFDRIKNTTSALPVLEQSKRKRSVRKIKPVTANDILRAIKTFLNWCVKKGYLHKNPAIEVKRFSEPELLPRYLTTHEITELLKKAKETHLYPFIMTALYTGMRKAELFNLEWPDVDFEHNRIAVLNKAAFRTKSGKFRIIPLHPDLKAVLAPIRKKDGYIFSSIRKNFRNEFQDLMKTAKIKANLHALRHTFASHLVSNGESLYKVSKLLGHAHTDTTEIYARLLPESTDNSLNKLKF